ncbi:antitoxin MazE7 [Streptomyces sp. NPDC097610]|uniref:antitoxin MazE7 n=1 Tax=Streptomyces sp. NPDC097610 TaxID=3157227 RepID=UPI003323BC82
MADTSVKVDTATRDLLKKLAGDRPIKDYLAVLAEKEEREQALNTATATFRRVLPEATLERFDADFGGLPPVKHDTQAA